MAFSKLQPVSYVEEMLTCSVCLELVTEPQTLSKCMHNYCAKCVQQLMKSQENKPPGVVCPVCRCFCKKEEIRNNHFVYDLLSQHKASLERNAQTKPKQCEQCPDGKQGGVAAWKCLDCRSNICDACRSQHLKIPLLRGHRIFELNEETEVVIDHLVFCTVHPDKPIEFYCNKCEEAICITCHVVNHSGHNIVTVQNALDRMVPDIDQDLNFLDESLKTIDQAVERCDVELEEVEKTFKQCSEAVDKETEDRIARLRKEQHKMKTELAKQEQIQRTTIEDQKNKLINKGKEISSLKNVTRTSLERARHASLLSELVNGGLCSRLKQVTKQPVNPQRLSIQRPTLKLNTRQWTALQQEGLLGEIAYTTNSVLVVDGVASGMNTAMNTAVSKYWPGKYTEFFKKTLKQTVQIELPDRCQKVTVCDDTLWVPLYNKNVVQVYTRGGELVKSVKVEGNPSCVVKTSTGEMLVSCDGSGLFVLCEDSGNTVKVAGGDHTDLCVCGDSVYTWDWRNKQIVEFVKEDGDWRQKSVISVGCVRDPHPWDTLLVRRCGEDSAQLEFFLCAIKQHTVYQVNSQGDKVRQFGGRREHGKGGLHYPMLCGVDSHGDILVADYSHCKYKLLNTVSGSCRTVYTADSDVWNATMEGENTVWLSRYTGGQCVITKHEVIL